MPIVLHTCLSLSSASKSCLHSSNSATDNIQVIIMNVLDKFMASKHSADRSRFQRLSNFQNYFKNGIKWGRKCWAWVIEAPPCRCRIQSSWNSPRQVDLVICQLMTHPWSVSWIAHPWYPVQIKWFKASLNLSFLHALEGPQDRQWIH